MPGHSLGAIWATVTLDRPGETYHGSEHPVRGVVSLSWHPSSSSGTITELFGPLQVDIVLQGTLESRLAVMKDPWGGDEYIHKCQEDRKLFRRVENLYDDAIRMVPMTSLDYPFEMLFPSSSDLPESESSTSIQTGTTKAQEAGSSSDEILPPSLSIRVKQGQVGGTSKVIYSITCDVRMPGIDVAVMSKQPAGHMLQYDLPPGSSIPTELASSWPQMYEVSNKYLLPESERSRGISFLGKKKEVPNFAFSMLLGQLPKHLCVGDAVKFDLYLFLHPESSTAVPTPAMSLQSCKVTLVRNSILENSKTRSKADVTKLEGDEDFPLQLVATPRVLNEGHSINGLRYNFELMTRPITDGVATFSMKDIQVSYFLKIELQVVVAKESRELTRRHAIVLHSTMPPPPFDTAADVKAVPQGSTEADNDKCQTYTKHDMELRIAKDGGMVDHYARLKSMTSITPWARKKHQQKYLASVQKQDEVLARSSKQQHKTELF